LQLPITVERRSLYEIRSPQLVETLRAWRSISDRDGCYDYTASVSPIFSKPGILLPTSTLILVEGENPLGYIFAWFGTGFGIVNNRSYCGYSVGDLPHRGLAHAAAEPLRDAVHDREIAYHRITCQIDGKPVAYERLILPMKEYGKVTAMVTASIFHPAAWPAGGGPGLN